MPSPNINAIAVALGRIASAWEKYIATRQEAYERKMNKHLKKALVHAAASYRRLHELKIDIDDKTFLKHKKNFYKHRSKA